MSDPGAQHSDDLREYYASNPAGEVNLGTIELCHPAFVAEDGETPVAVRFVNDPQDLQATLESDAPMNPGEEVNFVHGAFDITLTESSDNGIPQGQVAVENVTRPLMPWMQSAVSSGHPIDFTFREYLTADLSQPGVVYSGLTVQKANATALRVTATIGFEDDLNKPFPRVVYTTQEFNGLAR